MSLEKEALELEYQGETMNYVIDLSRLKQLYEDVQYYDMVGWFTNDPVHGYTYHYEEKKK